MFENKHYSSIMFVLMITVCLLLMFGFINLVSDKKTEENKLSITGKAVGDGLNNTNSTLRDIERQELNNLRAETFFYGLAVVVFILFMNLVIILFLIIKDRHHYESLG